MPKKRASFVVCITNENYEASLIPRRIYRLLPDQDAERHSLWRVIDESGEDYLFPSDLFARVDLPKEVERRLALTT